MSVESETLVLRKDAHWFVLEAPARAERGKMVLDLIALAEDRRFDDVPPADLQPFVASLGWELKVFGRSSNAA